MTAPVIGTLGVLVLLAGAGCYLLPSVRRYIDRRTEALLGDDEVGLLERRNAAQLAALTMDARGDAENARLRLEAATTAAREARLGKLEGAMTEAERRVLAAETEARIAAAPETAVSGDITPERLLELWQQYLVVARNEKSAHTAMSFEKFCSEMRG